MACRRVQNHMMSDRAGAEPAFSGGRASVRIYMAESVAHIDAGASMQEVVDELDADEVGLLLVGSADDVVGVVSERDLVRFLAARRDLTSTRAADVATTTPVWCDADATVHEVAELMMEHYVRHVLVRENGKLAGIVSARDLLGAYTASAE
jgi:CBS domain-containing protein